MPVTEVEATQIVVRIGPVFQQILNEYDFRKYPAAEYARFKASFSRLNSPNRDIEDAMIWKWGHWAKPGYPQRQRDLVAEIRNLWTRFVASEFSDTSDRTFRWWRARLNRPTTYITVAYITHLVHHNEPLPIIDQHNFRAMNSLMGCLRPLMTQKKPSNWNDIIMLRTFMSSILAVMPGRTFDELDRFLMMYGRNHAAR